MKFQPGQSGNPAGRPPGSLNKKTLAVEAAFEEKAQEIVDNVIERAKNGDLAAERLVMERMVPTARNRRFAIALPVIKTADDAEAALAVVMDELAAGKLAVHEVSSLLLAIDRALRVAERIWKMRQREREAQEAEARAAVVAAYVAALGDEARDQGIPAAAAAAKSAGASGEGLYSPVNQPTQPAECPGPRMDRPAPMANRETVPQAKAA
jgi:uncharacterized protein DUF5681